MTQQLQKSTIRTVSELLEKQRTSIASVLPKTMTADRVIRLAITELRNNPGLLACAPESLVSCIVRSAQIGLPINSLTGTAYLIPYKNEATLIIGYRGMLTLAAQSESIEKITAHAVHEKDAFEVRYGFDEELIHIPSRDQDRGPVTHYYAAAVLEKDQKQSEVMTAQEVESIRKRSRAGNSGPWITDPIAMGRKTVIRRLFKYLPLSIEMEKALEEDDDRLSAPAEKDITPRGPFVPTGLTPSNVNVGALDVGNTTYPVIGDVETTYEEGSGQELCNEPDPVQAQHPEPIENVAVRQILDAETGEHTWYHELAGFWNHELHSDPPVLTAKGKWRRRRGTGGKPDPEPRHADDGKADQESPERSVDGIAEINESEVPL